jgi:hypothetical protein
MKTFYQWYYRTFEGENLHYTTHFLGGFFISTIFSAIFSSFTLGLLIGVIAGILKEVMDKESKLGSVDRKAVVLTMLGAFISYITLLFL